MRKSTPKSRPVKHSDREFRRLHARVVAAQEEERKHLARELHDGVGQILTGIKFGLQSLTDRSVSGRDGAEKIRVMGRRLDYAISEIRRVSHNLVPPELSDLGLEPALLKLCREYRECLGVQVSVRSVPAAVPPEPALALFRIAQEALNNIGKHSKATKISVSLSLEGRDVVLSVSDNGIGFSLAGAPSDGGGIGLGNMRQRAESIGGTIEVHSKPGAGTRLSVHAPLTGVEGGVA